ncbi:MAG TPA: type II CRISPR RNA-guided endonuclease Cas9, partial [Bacteroidales bacterium]|nr:type II CRISPR RNA-guided endonuclease Cas9 [Bacteroidales bacterium]
MKKILGLDLGVSSIGWAMVEEDESSKSIAGMGTRIVPLTSDDIKEFTSGNAITRNQERRTKRMQRRRYDRFQLRRETLKRALMKKKMMPDDDLLQAEKLRLWNLRSMAAKEKVGLQELGRVLLHLNQKRGYKSSRKENQTDKKETEYVAEVKNRYDRLRETGLTVGEFFYEKLLNDRYYRIKNQIFPREAYMEEYNTIMKTQKEFYPELLTDDFIRMIRDNIIFFQRPLKSQKKLVSTCEFEKRKVLVEDGKGGKKEALKGPKVAHRSSPLFQICRIWENINNIKIRNKYNEEYKIPVEKKHEIFEYLQSNERLKFKPLLKILGLKNTSEWTCDALLEEKGIEGNRTMIRIAKCLNDHTQAKELMRFDLVIKKTDKTVEFPDKSTGEIINIPHKFIDPSVEKQPFYKLWHTIYSIADENECKNTLIKNFNLPEETAEKLADIDFVKEGYGSKSVKAIRKILPYLMDGYLYNDACSLAGYNHSGSLTKEEKDARQVIEKLPLIEKNTLRQPIVEKILNQMINLVNAISDKYGKPDEIRIELARELKQSKEERSKTSQNINRRERENNKIKERLENEYGQRATRNNVLKWRLFHAVWEDESKVNNICLYCGKAFGIGDALSGTEVDIEHIIPRTLFFDDSENNKILAHRKCNQAKGNMTAYDYMKSRGDKEFDDFIHRVNNLYSQNIISRTKRERLLTPAEKIPKDFIKRQLRETQYISRKAVEILSMICRDVNTTSGSVTEFLRRLWGWDDVLMNLQIPRYREQGLTEWIDFEKDGHKITKEIIPDWT